MALLTLADIALDEAQGVTEPRGFLRARHVGETPGSAEFGTVLRSILASVEAHLDALNISAASTAGRHKIAARHLARHYAAEAVLANADTGTDRDQTGASTSLSAGDLSHWERMRDSALASAEQIIGKVGGGATSGVFFAGVKVKPRDDDASF